jgi:hypothetical protein
VQSFHPANKQRLLSDIDFLKSMQKQAGEQGKVDIKDLSWTDKERLLRVLFAKMNGFAMMQAQAISGGGQASEGLKDLRAYKGGEYPLGPSAFTGSMADKVDRIISIDDEHPEEQENDKEVAPVQEAPMVKEEPQGPTLVLPTFSFGEDSFVEESAIPSINVEPLPPILVIAEEQNQ